MRNTRSMTSIVGMMTWQKTIDTKARVIEQNIATIEITVSMINAELVDMICRYIFHSYVQSSAASHKYFAALSFALGPTAVPATSHRIQRAGSGAPLMESTETTPNASRPTSPILSIHTIQAPPTKQAIPPFVLLVLIRLAPFPYNFFNLLLSSIGIIELSRFVLATALANVKIMLDVSIGASISRMSDVSSPSSTWARLLPPLFGVSVAVIAIGCVGFVVKRRLKEVTQILAEQASAPPSIICGTDGTGTR